MSTGYHNRHSTMIAWETNRRGLQPSRRPGSIAALMAIVILAGSQGAFCQNRGNHGHHSRQQHRHPPRQQSQHQADDGYRFGTTRPSTQQPTHFNYFPDESEQGTAGDYLSVPGRSYPRDRRDHQRNLPRDHHQGLYPNHHRGYYRGHLQNHQRPYRHHRRRLLLRNQWHDPGYDRPATYDYGQYQWPDRRTILYYRDPALSERETNDRPNDVDERSPSSRNSSWNGLPRNWDLDRWGQNSGAQNSWDQQPTSAEPSNRPRALRPARGSDGPGYQTTPPQPQQTAPTAQPPESPRPRLDGRQPTDQLNGSSPNSSGSSPRPEPRVRVYRWRDDGETLVLANQAWLEQPTPFQRLSRWGRDIWTGDRLVFSRYYIKQIVFCWQEYYAPTTWWGRLWTALPTAADNKDTPTAGKTL